MAAEVVTALNIRSDGIYVDATYGRGGHTRAILDCLGPHGRLLAIDRDPDAAMSYQHEFAAETRAQLVKAPFSDLEATFRHYELAKVASGVLFDLGVSSPQLDTPQRGFSFLRDGPLDMRMDPGTGSSAQEWLMAVDQDELAEIIRRLGEERFARRIARAIVAHRASGGLSSTGTLAALVCAAVPSREPGKHPATRTFQAIRMHLNDELGELEAGLPQAIRLLEDGGRLVAISFHSLEDRIVKRVLRRAAKGDPFPPRLPVMAKQMRPVVRLIGKPTRPTASEISNNIRARSAIMRVAEKVRFDA